MISSHVKISMISVTSGLSLKLYLNSLVHHRNIFGSSSKVFGNLRKSSDIFGNFRKFSENVRERSSGLWDNFGKSSEIFGNWSEIFGKSSKRRYQYVYIIKRTLHVSSKIWILCYSWQEQYLLPLEHKIHIFSPPCNTLYVYKMHQSIPAVPTPLPPPPPVQLRGHLLTLSALGMGHSQIYRSPGAGH